MCVKKQTNKQNTTVTVTERHNSLKFIFEIARQKQFGKFGFTT